MKNEEYQIGYKYGYKIGYYKSGHDMSVKFFKMIFGREFEYERKRIKWLSNYELELLLEEMIEYLSKYRKKPGKNDETELSKYKFEILKLLI